MTIFQSVNSPPQYLSMLIDPRGVVHVTSGVQPSKAISIPPDQYAPALQAIEITFLTAPILTQAGMIQLPLPAEAGYQWSWLQNHSGVWTEISARGVIEKQIFIKRFPNDAESIWSELKTKNWIQEIDTSKASVSAKDRRSDKLRQELADKTPEIEEILNRQQIKPIDLTARFSGPAEIREGWLKLSVDHTSTGSTP